MRRLIFAALFAAGIIALVYLQRAKPTTPISPDPLVHFIAESGR